MTESHRIAIFGASGFVGSALCERLAYEGRAITAYVHGTGNCWRLTRSPLPLERVDICDARAVAAAIRDCSVVVNCTRGGDRVMLQGLRTMLRAAQDADVRKFIHLSSLAIYGDNPAPDAVTEEGSTGGPWLNPYGKIKLSQDELVFKAQREGLPCYVLCPGNVGGPYSLFVLELAKRLASGPFSLVEEGRNPTNIVHIDNLVQAILCAIDSESGAGQRYFVNDSPPVSWYDFCTALCREIKSEPEFFEVPYDDILGAVKPKQVRSGVREHIRIALSGEFRNALSLLPAIGWANTVASKAFNRFPQSVQSSMRAKFGTIHVDKHSELNLSDPYLKVQIRRPYHSPAKLMDTLHYRQAVDYEHALDSTGKYLRFGFCYPETFPSLPDISRSVCVFQPVLRTTRDSLPHE